MIIECPNCATKYNLPDDKFKEGGKAKCKACKHVFIMEKTPQRHAYSQDYSSDDELSRRSSEEDKGVDDILAGLGGEFDPLQDSIPVEGEGEQEAFRNASKGEGDDFGLHEEKAAPPKKRDVERDDDSFGELRQSLNLDLDGGRTKPKKRRRFLKFLFFLIFLMILLGGGYYAVSTFYPDLLPEELKMPWLEQMRTPEQPAPQAPIVPTNQVKNISLVNVKQYFVKNEKIGKVFVIEGAVVNNFEAPKEMIKIEASLYDAKGKVLDTKQQFCGNIVSLFQLQVLTQEELESHLKNEIGILSKNTFVQPGGDVPFMVLFYGAPNEVREFAVNVVEARDPPEQK